MLSGAKQNKSENEGSPFSGPPSSGWKSSWWIFFLHRLKLNSAATCMCSHIMSRTSIRERGMEGLGKFRRAPLPVEPSGSQVWPKELNLIEIKKEGTEVISWIFHACFWENKISNYGLNINHISFITWDYCRHSICLNDWDLMHPFAPIHSCLF